MKVVVINGAPGAGKDAFVQCCQKHCFWCSNVSTVDFVKDVAKFCGWDGTKTPKDRKFLSDLKKLLGDWSDVPFQKVKQTVKNLETTMTTWDYNPDTDGIIFIHCREPEEIARFVKELNAITLLIQRPAVEGQEQSNQSDKEVFNYVYDYMICNDQGLAELELEAVDFMTNLGIRYLH